jgi:putative drug exporter of the RND superfamily
LLFSKLGKFTYTYRKLIVAFWIVVVALLLSFAVKLPEQLKGSGFEMDSEFNEVMNQLQEDFHYPTSTIILYFESENFAPHNEKYVNHVNDTIANISQHSSIEKIISPFQTPGMIAGNDAFAIVMFQKESSDLKEEISFIKNELISTKEIKTMLTGSAVINEDMNNASQEDLFKAEMIGVPAALIVLLFAFGGVIAAALPLLIGIVSVIITTALTYFIGGQVDLSVFVLNVVPMIGLALSIDFALLLVNRFREEISGKSVQEAIVKSVETAGKAIAFSGLCVFVGLSGMLFIKINIFKSIGIGAMVVVLVSVLCALTFLPAILAMLGEKVNRLTLFKTSNKAHASWGKFATFVMKRPVRLLLVTATILIAATIPAMSSNLIVPEEDSLPEKFESRIAFEKYKETFGDQTLPSLILIAKSDVNILENEEEILKLQNFVESIKADASVKRVESLFEVTSLSAIALNTMKNDPAFLENVETVVNGKQTVIKVFLNVESASDEAKHWIEKWSGKSTDYTLLIGGEGKFYEEIYSEIATKAPLGLLVVLVSTYFLLLIAFKSVLLPLKAIVMNMLSLVATFGILVIIFESGLFYQSEGIYLVIPVFIFCLVFGLSMDYEVFLISRIQEYYEETKDNDYATLMGLTATSKIITSAALIMIVITGAFTFTDIMPVKQMGLGIAIAILLDATIVRMLLVPSLMKLLGDLNWWMPQFLKGKRKRTVINQEERSV